MATADDSSNSGISRWWRVVGGMSMNLALGTLYAWSVFVAPLEKEFGWKRAETSNVFTIAVVVFALTFILAGRLQDKFGPFWVSLTGGVLVSLGFFLCSFTHSLTYLYVCFGVIGGLGNGFGYATPIPVMAKWFPDKRGLAVGLAVGGYGAGSAHLRTAGQFETDSCLWRAHHLHDPGRDLSGDDGFWFVPAAQSSCGIQAGGLGADSRGQGCSVDSRVQPRRSFAYACFLPDVGRLRVGVLSRIDGDQPTGAIREERGDSDHCASDHGTGRGRGRQCLGSNLVGLDVRYARAAEHVASHDRHLDVGHADSLPGWRQRGAAVCDGVCRVLVLRDAVVGEWLDCGRFLGNEECRHQLRNAVHGVGRSRHYWAADRRGAFRQVQELPDGVLLRRGAGCGCSDLRIGGQASYHTGGSSGRNAGDGGGLVFRGENRWALQ